MNNVKLICSVITGRSDLFDMFRKALAGEFGLIDIESDVFPFDHTDYYEKQIGPDLARKIYSFEELIDPGTIADVKLNTIQMEKHLTKAADSDVERVVNLDPGYVGMLKMVLATTKDRGHRIYLRDGIYAEVTLQYVSGGFQGLPSTYPDYRLPEYREFFNAVRSQLRVSLR